DESLITALNEDFNGSGLPPGWQMTSNCLGWFMTLDGSSFEWTIPTWNSQYMCVNENAQGSMCSGSVDYLITPPLDLRETDNFRMEFDSYFDKKFGVQIATVEYSYDFGTSWDEIYSLTPVPDKWDHLEIDLSAFSGPYSEPGVLFAFHSNDGGSWGSGWAVDNVEILAGPANPDNYYVYLDGSVYDITDTLFYQYYELNYGQTYTACVTANYSCGPSDMLCVDFTSAYLRAPEWLIADSMGLDIVLTWFMDTMDIDEQILGFNVYRDSLNIAFVPYIGEDTSYYTDVAPPPMCYDYQVSTLHDLSTYGFPGDTGESLYTGPEEVCLVYGAMLPIVEEWFSGSFGSFWTAEDHWVINGQYGNPLPCAEFKWDPVLMDYQQCLTSDPINGVDHGTKSEPYIDGQFILNFDVSLVDNGASGTEYFNVEVWSDGAWNRVEQLSNANGNFEWENVEVDISEYALGYVFKVRFMAEGEASYNILSWMLDNIEIFHYCAPPVDLYADFYAYHEIYLEWSPPISNVAAYEWISWDDGVHYNGVGLTGGGVFSVASHWDADQITAYEGMYITKIRFVPYINAVTTSFTLKVWEGPDAGTLVYEEALSSLVPGEWNDITLATPVAIDVTQELWFGYTMDSPDGENPAGRDAGPAIAGYGDMISLDGIAWDPLSHISTIDGNWNLQALIAGGDESKSELLLKNDSQKTLSDSRTGSKGIIGYNIYLDKLQDEYEFVDFTEDTSYTYEYQGGSLLFFVVTTVYEDCESGYSNVACVSIGIDENDKNNVIRIFPNPASDMITVESSVRMSRLCLLDYSGRSLQCHELQNQIQTSLDVSSCEPGIYLLRVDTEEGRFVRKLVVAR
ncbi:MAG: T9SS type A sorting domain-containing protein, partial [Bacteroidetes bacterium]|nr:T9SS type A sorting domain-containing protein [Bacteroidota bacterium]